MKLLLEVIGCMTLSTTTPQSIGLQQLGRILSFVVLFFQYIPLKAINYSIECLFYGSHQRTFD